jgi:hypothetical protein
MTSPSWVRCTPAPLHLIPFLRDIWAPARIGTYAEVRYFRCSSVTREYFLQSYHGQWFPAARRPPQAESVVFSLNPRSRTDGHIDAVDDYVALFADLDDWGVSEQKVADLAAAGVSASAVVQSGSEGHYHLYFFLQQPTPVSAALPQARRLCAALGSDPVFYPNVCARLPGTVNRKDPTNARRVNLVELRGDRYRIENVQAALDAVGAPAATEAHTSSRRRHISHAQGLIVPTDDPTRIQAIIRALPAWCQILIANGKVSDDRYSSRSEADAAVVRVLLDIGAEGDEIAFIFARHPDGIGARYAERGDRYLDRTIDFVRRNSPDESWAIVNRVTTRGAGSRVVLDLSVYFGAYAGTQLQHGVESTCSAWPYLFLSAGLRPPRVGDATKALGLVERDLRLRLEQVHHRGSKRVQVRRLLPQLDQEAAR